MKGLLSLNAEFRSTHGRSVRVWYDKFCIKQDEFAMENVSMLPVFMSQCRGMLIMHSKSWRERLWCQSEVADKYLIGRGYDSDHVYDWDNSRYYLFLWEVMLFLCGLCGLCGVRALLLLFVSRVSAL
jgi:hypothetical protein